MAMVADCPVALTRLGFAGLTGWSEQDFDTALAVFARSARRHLERPYRQRQIAFDAAAFEVACRHAIAGPGTARGFFERHFAPFLIEAGDGDGFVTGYYEPEIAASRRRTARFAVPFLRRPPDLVELDDTEAARIGPDGARFARRDGDRLAPYPDRAAIDAGALDGQGLEIAWVADPVDAFFAHVQGCARLTFADGSAARLTYDGKSGHPFTGIGRILIDAGEIPAQDISMQSIRAWLARNPSRMRETLHLNRSYIFFRETSVDDTALGPVAAAKVPLTPGHSIAVDRTIHAFGLPFYIEAPTLDAFGGTGFRRLMIAQDTGSAILGAARADLFAGSGDHAGAIAGGIRHPARFVILLPVAVSAAEPGR